ncbi:MAG: hypothetical protein LBC13_00450 [Clostridiales bacterium]|jgi:hypothetical protein|nr:hypothetical protein [Clostridiales bacterium]
MAKEVKITQGDLYAARIFFYAAIPLLKVICESEPKYGDKFKGKSFVFQISALYDKADGGKFATHFVVEDGKWTTHVGEIHESPDVELEFSDLKKFIIFFTGKGMPLPKIRGLLKLGIFVPILLALLRMAGLMQAKDKPEKLEDQIMLCKLYLYLIPNGMSQLNKLGHPDVKAVTSISPDRAYALVIEGYPDLRSWIRMKAGKTMSGRGEYKRCKPFLAMNFKNPSLALDILMSKADMVQYIREEKLFIDGAPEFGGIVGNLMFAVAYYALGTYLDAEK